MSPIAPTLVCVLLLSLVVQPVIIRWLRSRWISLCRARPSVGTAGGA
jgi:hypothetical protein